MTSGSTFPRRFTKIDPLSLPDHFYLTADDECYFLGEYTARKGYSFSDTNQLILNLKKTMDRRGKMDWPYKAAAIRKAARAFQVALNVSARTSFTFVPVPPSRAKSDPLYDDRLVQMLRGIWPGQQVDVRELINQTASTEASHDSQSRPTPAELISRYVLDGELLTPQPRAIAIIDDVLTTGSHFVAARTVLRHVLPDAQIVGLFVARRVPETMDFQDLEIP